MFSRRFLRVFSWLWLLVSFGAGCSREARGRPEAAPAADDSKLREQIRANVSDSNPNLRFTYLDKDGRFRLARRRDEIPKEARGAVMVVDFSRPGGTGEHVVVADLRQPVGGDRYDAWEMKRDDFERMARERSEQAVDRPKVTMYATSWCGVCERARRFFQEHKVKYVERDVEKDPPAAHELKRKVERAGVQAGGVPVFDIGGQIVSGFDESTLRRLLKLQ